MIRSLKKRGLGTVREVPVPDQLLVQLAGLLPAQARCWPWVWIGFEA
ncbi:hypothetical protein [Methylobacterium sp. Leaf469]|nr:hypothetical protein [Methylobacterium sp. Leaf469]